jgi:DnaK suppressor protein
VNDKQRTQYRTKLLAMRDEIVSSGPKKIEPNRTDAATVGVSDEDAQALSEMMQTLASQQNKQQAEVVGRIDLALRKIDTEPEEFGVCEECGDDISEKRLSFMPYATLCIECQTAQDPKRGERRRHAGDFR